MGEKVSGERSVSLLRGSPKLTNFQFNYPIAFADESLYQSPAKISKIEAIPQTLIIKDRKIEGVYVGAGKTAKKNIKLKIAELLK